MKNSINNILAIGFGLCLLLIVAMVGFNFSALQKLEKLNMETLKRSVDMELATDAQHIGENLYMVIANSVINQNMAKSERGWAAAKTEGLEKLRKMSLASDTLEEKTKSKEAKEAFNAIIHIYEQEMLPIIMKGTVLPGPISEIDARLDREIDVIDSAMQIVARSMSNENQTAEREFHEVLLKTIKYGLFFSLIGVIAALYISVRASRRIVRPLTEITRAAQEMEKGNYLVELNHQSQDEIGMLASTFRSMSEQVEIRTVELLVMNEQLQREISDRTLAEEEICRLNAELEQRVVERTSDLINANELLKQMIVTQKQVDQELKKKNVEIEQFLYTVSHDLRSPLVTVKTFMGFLEKDMAEDNREQLAQDIQYIHGAADKMKLLLDELLELSRIGRVEQHQVRVSLLEVLDEVLDALAGAIAERKADIQLPDTDLMLFGDRPRLCQIWQNLIENAIKYSRDDSIPRIELGIHQMGEEKVFFVKDDGIGIDPQYHSKIFGIFEKLNPKSPGAGLGLSMIQRIVEKCGGRIWVESEGSGKGSCFFLTLPQVVIQS